MGEGVGYSLGLKEGENEGISEGTREGATVGESVGKVGERERDEGEGVATVKVGLKEGEDDGIEGERVGPPVKIFVASISFVYHVPPINPP